MSVSFFCTKNHPSFVYKIVRDTFSVVNSHSDGKNTMWRKDMKEDETSRDGKYEAKKTSTMGIGRKSLWDDAVIGDSCMGKRFRMML